MKVCIFHYPKMHFYLIVEDFFSKELLCQFGTLSTGLRQNAKGGIKMEWHFVDVS